MRYILVQKEEEGLGEQNQSVINRFEACSHVEAREKALRIDPKGLADLTQVIPRSGPSPWSK